MYYPYFRGKQYELILLRENASLFKSSNFIPVIEPVKESFSGLERTLIEFKKLESEVIVIVNPYHGDHSDDNDKICNFINENLSGFKNLSIGILLKSEADLNSMRDIFGIFRDNNFTLIHYGFADAVKLMPLITHENNVKRHIFIGNYSGRLYRKHFAAYKRVLVQDGFQKRTNREHPDTEIFSDLHVTYIDESVDGFGDFLIVGDDYSESGGPAYTVAIHITFIDSAKDNEMWIYHFKSNSNDTPTDPGGKFSEALEKLVFEVNKPDSKIYKTRAITEFLDLSGRGHFPGLGYVKKLSMQHHLETLERFLNG